MTNTYEFWADTRMPYVESRRACQSRVCYKSHNHPTFSIGAVDEGRSEFKSFFADAQKIEKGSVVVVPAHVEHACNPLHGQPWSYQMLHLDADWLARLLDELHVNDASCVLPKWQPSILKNPEIYAAFCQLNEVLFAQDILIIEKEQYLIECLTQILLPHFQWQQMPKIEYGQNLLQRLLDLCLSADTFISLDTLAQSVGISRYAVIRLFKNNMGLTPHAFQLNLKIQQARQLLKQGINITQVAHDLGFSDQSHFHKAFKQYIGITPKQFQNEFPRNFLQEKSISEF